MHEDHSVEIYLSGKLPLMTALVIASGGDLAFTLAGAGLSVMAVDTNPAQIDAVKLKLKLASDHCPEHCQQTFIGSAHHPGWCFSGKVDRVLRWIGPLLAYAYGWRGRKQRRWLIDAAFPFLKCGVRLVHGLGAGARIDDQALRVLRTRFETAVASPGSSENPYLHALMGKGFGNHPPCPWKAFHIGRWKDGEISLETCTISDGLKKCEPDSLGLISVSNLYDVLDAEQWQELMELAWRALASGGCVVVRSMIAESISMQSTHSFRTLPLPAQDLSPLCPVVWVGQKP